MHLGQRTKFVVVLLAVVAVVLLVLALIGEPIEEGRCKLVRKKADPDSQLLGLAFQFLRPLADRPDGVQDGPADFAQPRYYHIKSGDKPILMAADFSRKQVRLCIDTDDDGLLSEERCLTARLSKETPVSGRRQQFGPISLIFGRGTAKTDGAFYVNCFREDARGLLIPYPAYFRTGKLRLAGQTYRVAVVDGDHDGLYRSILSLPLDNAWRLPGCDVFAIDLNQNGTFEVSLSQPSEVMPLGRLVRVADAYYAIDVTPDNTSLTLSRTEPQFGTLVIEPNDAPVDLKLWSDAADRYLSQGGAWQLPAGTYKAVNLRLEKTDASGACWAFSLATNVATSHLGALDFFTIEPGQTTSIHIGPPFVIRADVEKTGPRVVSIAPAIVGCGGEEYDIGFRRNHRRAPEPAFRIVDEEGTVLVDDRFQYG